MPNSNQTPVINTPSNHTPFKAGDKVLCPTIGNKSYTLKKSMIHQYMELEGDPIHRLFDTDGTRKDGDNVQLFHDTPANRQAIATLFGQQVGNNGMVNMTTPKPTRKVIDLTDSDDDEVIVIGACDFSSIACDVFGSSEVLADISTLFSLICHNDLTPHQIKSLSRLSQCAIDTWQELLDCRLDDLNKPLAQTAFGKVEG